MTIYACPSPDCLRLTSDPRGCEEHVWLGSEPDVPERALGDEPDTDLFDWEHDDDFTAGDGVHHRDASILRILHHLDNLDNEEGTT